MPRTVNKVKRDKAIGLMVECGNKSEVARRIGVNRDTVAAWVKESEAETLAAVKEYRAQLSESLPIAARVKRLRELIEQNDHPIVALKALDGADRRNGYLVDSDNHVGTQQQAPMFALPPGSRVAIQVGSNDVGTRPGDGERSSEGSDE